MLARTLRLAAAGLLLGSVLHSAHAAEVVISVNKSTQSMSVLIDGAEAHNWVVSTGSGGGPPDGTFRPERLHRHWFSRTFNMAPMPYSIFFQGPYAIHGTDKISMLGRRASKGCVRLHPRDAAVLFDLVQRERANTTIVISKTTHVAARVTPDKSDAQPGTAAQADAVKAAEPATPAVQQAEATPVRKRVKRKQAKRETPAPLPFGANFATALPR